MSVLPTGDSLGEGIAAVLRFGTLAAIGAVGIGYAMALATGDDPGPIPVTEVLVRGGGGAVIGLGMLGLAVVPAGVLAVAALGFHRRGERRLTALSLLMLAVLVVSLAVAVAVAPAG